MIYQVEVQLYTTGNVAVNNNNAINIVSKEGM